MSFFNTVEFYVIAATAAAAGLAAVALPRRGRVRATHLLAGDLITATEPAEAESCIDIEVGPSGAVHLCRRGLRGITDTGAVSLAISLTDRHEVIIEERLTPGGGWPTVEAALFTLDFLGPMRYQVRYDSPSLGLFTAFTLNVAPGLSVHRPLRQ